METGRLRRGSRRSVTARVLALVVVMVPALLIAGCSDDGSTSAGGGATSASTVDIPASKFSNSAHRASVAVNVVDNEFDKPYVIVTAGTKVTWSNKGRNEHSVTPVRAGAFDGVNRADFGAGQTHSAVFAKPGDYPYYCTIHGTAKLNGQAGVIRVVAAT